MFVIGMQGAGFKFCHSVASKTFINSKQQFYKYKLLFGSGTSYLFF